MPALPGMPAIPGAPGLPAVPVLGAAPAPLPRTLEITIQADSLLNQDARNRNAPLMVRIYTLKAPLGFQSADFFSLFERDQTLLAADLLSRDELQLQPGETRRLVIEVRPEARVVGVMGAFRDLDRANWRAVYSLPDTSDPAIRLLARPVKLPVRVGLGAREVRVSAQ